MSGNFFDQFEDASPATPPKSSGNFFDQFEDQPRRVSSTSSSLSLANAPEESAISSLAKGAGTAVIKGLANIPGMFGNIRDFGNYLGDRAFSAATGKPLEELRAVPPRPMSSILPTGEQIAAPILQRTGEYKPETELGRMAQTGLETGIGMLGPGAGAAAEGALARTAMASTARMAPGAALAGAAAQGATDITGDPLVGFLAGMVAPGLATTARMGATSAIRPMIEDIPGLGKAFAGTREGLAGEELINAAQNPEAVYEGLWPAQGPRNLEPVPGSRPTTGQLTGDMGLLQAERQARTADNTSFNDLEAQQNAARRAALTGIAPQGADVMRPSQLFQQQKEATTAAMDAAHMRIQDHAVNLVRGFGDTVPAEQIGSQLRTAIENVRGEEKKAVSKLYRAVDPNGKLSMVAVPLREGAQEIAGRVDPYGAPMSADEQRIFGKTQALPDVMPFKSIMELDKDVTDAMRRERMTSGESATWARLSQLKGRVQDAINNAIDNQHAWEQEQVSRGVISPDDTLESRIRNVNTGFPGQEGNAGAGVGARAAGAGRPAPGVAPAGGRAEGAGNRGFGNAPGGAGISGGSAENPPAQGFVAYHGSPHDFTQFDLSKIGTNEGNQYFGRGMYLSDSPEFAKQYGDRWRTGTLGNLYTAKVNVDKNAFLDWDKPLEKQTMDVQDKLKQAFPEHPNIGTKYGVYGATPNVLNDLNKSYGQEAVAKKLDAVGIPGIAHGEQEEGQIIPGLKNYVVFNPKNIAITHRNGVPVETPSEFSGNLSSLPQRQMGIRTLIDFLRDRGGLKDEGGDLRAAEMNSRFKGLINKNGMSLDRAREAAAEAGYLGADTDRAMAETTPNDLLDAIESHPVYSVHDHARVAEHEAYANRRDKIANNVADLDAAFNRLKQNPSRAAVERAAELMHDENLSPDEAFHKAIMRNVENVAGKEKPYGAGAQEPPPPPSPAVAPNMDQRAAEALSAAKKSYAEYAKTYKAQPVAGAIKTVGFSGQYATPASALPGRAVVKGDKGYETASAFLKAAKDAPEAVSAMQDAALNPLRARVKPDGTIDAKAVADWKKQYAGALKALDEKRPSFSSSFDKAGGASDKLAEFAATRKAQEAAFQKSAAAKFIGANSPVEVENRIGALLTTPKDGVTQLRQLLKQAGNNPAAVEGLRKAAIDYVARKFSNVAEAGTSEQKLLSSAKFQNLVRDFEPNLSVLFDEKQVNTLRAIAKDLELSDRSVQATRIKGSPGTAKDVLPFLSKQTKETMTHGSMLLAAMETLQLAHERGGLKGVALAGIPLAGAAGFKYWRGNAMEKVQNLVREGLEDPAVAQRLIMKIPRDRVSAQAQLVSNSIRRGLIAGSAAKENEERSERASGGRVSKRDYPAKKASHIEKMAMRTHERFANELRPLMHAPDHVVAQALRLSK